ncbi:uncharacterized protein LOC107428621 [Ziziphus jujuba]|uniref:Uncharacterized protein LOC107428621 n=1 Tax=Ziziphus jujuba TaxID=326968 RepID=A0ABM3ZXM2_ZIZJJ|nr:uncharacterized protein LOC107428621 [Ziziphus jujuba]
METNLIMHNQKKGVLDILKKALQISSKNINFIIFILIISSPLFCFLVYYEFFLQKFLVETFENLYDPPDYFYYYWLEIFHIAERLNKKTFLEFIQLVFLYLVPLHLLEFCTVLVIVDLTSKIYSEERPMTLKDLLNMPVEVTRLKGTFITFVYVAILSVCTLLGLTWLVTTYFILLRSCFSYVLFAAVCGAIFVSVLTIYSALSAECNMSIVISILEGIYGVEALALSAYFSRGNYRCGLNLMLVFLLWGIGLRLPCLYFGCYEEGYGIVAQISLVCLGNALKWIVCVVYFHECKKQILEKKYDEEVGTDVSAVD